MVPTDAVTHQIWKLGRVLAVCVSDSHSDWHFGNVHIFEVRAEVIGQIRDELSHRPPLAAPPFSVVDFFGGDFKCIGDDDLVLHTCGGAPHVERAGVRHVQRSWARALTTTIEIATDDYTYYNLANGTHPRIDKVFVRLPHGSSPLSISRTPPLTTPLTYAGAGSATTALRCRGLSATLHAHSVEADPQSLVPAPGVRRPHRGLC